MIKNETKANYPSHNLDPIQKDKDWCLSYAKAAWFDYTNHGTQSFNNNRGSYAKIKDYAQGNQSVNKYKQLLNVDESDNESWFAIDWTVLPIVPKFRRIALGKLNKTEYNITATPIDAIAQADIEDYYKRTKAKMDLRQSISKTVPGMEEFSALKKAPKDPENDEELEMHMNYTFKHNASIEMEQGIDLVFHTNGMDEKRKQVMEYLFDFGAAGYKEYIDSNGAVKIRVVNPSKLLISHCNKRDFSDKIHMGEITEMSISDLKQRAGNQFNEKEYQDIAERFSGRKGSTRMNTSNKLFSKNYDDSKILVLEMEFFSVDQMVHESRTDRRGNKRFGRAGYNSQNKRKNKYVRSSYKTVYKISWIVDSDYCYDYGLCNDMKRVKSKLMDTDLSYHLFSPDFHNMKPLGIMEQLIPIADQIQISWYRLQNTINQARPKGIMIELGALEDIPLGS